MPYRDVIYYGDPLQPECDVILDDGFDQICIQIKIETRVEFVEVPGETVYVEVPTEKIIEVIRTVEVPGETVYIKVPGETVYVEVPIKEIVEVEKIVEVPVVYQPKVYHLMISIPEQAVSEPIDIEDDGICGTVTLEDDLV